MHSYTLLGLTAAVCTTSAFLPQTLRIIKTRQTTDVSLGMYVIFSIGTFLWMIYGILVKDIPVVAANSISFLFSVTIMALKIRYK